LARPAGEPFAVVSPTRSVIQLLTLTGCQIGPSAQQQPALAFHHASIRPPLRKNSDRRTSSMASLACCMMWNLSYTIRHWGSHSSRLNRNGSHMSTHTASIPYRRRVLNSSWKNDPPVSERAVSACGRSFRVQLWQVRGLSCAWRPRGVMGVSGRPVGRLAWCLSASLSRSHSAPGRRKSSALSGEA